MAAGDKTLPFSNANVPAFTSEPFGRTLLPACKFSSSMINSPFDGFNFFLHYNRIGSRWNSCTSKNAYCIFWLKNKSSLLPAATLSNNF